MSATAKKRFTPLLPDGMTVGVDPEADRRRFDVTEQGITLICPKNLGQPEPHYAAKAVLEML